MATITRAFSVSPPPRGGPLTAAGPNSSPLGRWAAACFVLLIAALPWTIAPMSIMAIATAVLTLSLWLRRPSPHWPDAPVGRAWLAWALALGLATAFALDPVASAHRLEKAFFPGLIALAAFHTPGLRPGRRAIAVLFVSSAVASVYGTVFFVAHGATFAARSRGAVGHYMTYAGQLLLLVSAAVPVALQAREPSWRWGAAVTAVLGLVALVGTFTRSAWIGLAVSLAVTVAAVRPRWLIGLAALLAVVYVAAPGSYRDRLHSAFDPHHPMNLERTYMWDAGWRMFRDHPLTGVGLEDLHPIYARYRLPLAREAAGHLHSVPVQIAATMGLAGLAAFGWLFVSLLRAAGFGLRPMLRSPSVESGLRLGVLSGLAGFAVAGLFEWNFGDEELLYLLFTLVGLAWAARTWGGGVAAAPAAGTPARAGAMAHVGGTGGGAPGG